MEGCQHDKLSSTRASIKTHIKPSQGTLLKSPPPLILWPKEAARCAAGDVILHHVQQVHQGRCQHGRMKMNKTNSQRTRLQINGLLLAWSSSASCVWTPRRNDSIRNRARRVATDSKMRRRKAKERKQGESRASADMMVNRTKWKAHVL